MAFLDLSDPTRNIVKSSLSDRVFKELAKKEKEKDEEKEKEKMLLQTTEKKGKRKISKQSKREFAAAALTSSSFDVDLIKHEKIRAKSTKKKGYAQLQTNMGNINLEIHCDLVRKRNTIG